jgi:hypothetical protein
MYVCFIGLCIPLWSLCFQVYFSTHKIGGPWGGEVVKALRYYSDGPGSDSR